MLSVAQGKGASKTKKLLVKTVKRILFVILGAALVSVGLEIFLVPNHIIDGGVTGVSIILSHLTGVELGIYLFLLNLPFLIIGYKQIGKTFAFYSLAGVILMSIGTTLLHPVASLTRDPLLAAVFGGIIVGIGVGMVIRYGGSLDGTEIVAILINSRTPLSVGETILFFNIFILGSAGFVYGWDRAMYSLIAYYIAFKMIDLVIEGLGESKAVWIISDEYQQIGDAILKRLGRGVTYLQGAGAYTGDNKQVIFVVVTRLEEVELKSIVEEIDSAAFLAIATIAEVRGGRFKQSVLH